MELVQPLAAAGVHELFLGRNAIGDTGGAALARGGAHADAAGARVRPFQRLGLMSNGLGDAAARALGAALADETCPLVALNLGHNKIGDAGMASLAEGVRRNARIASLDVGVNPASNAAKSAVANLMLRDEQSRRRVAKFRDAAKLLLLANHAPRSADELLGKLPHGVMLTVLEMASPPGFDTAQLHRPRAAPGGGGGDSASGAAALPAIT